MRVAGVEVTLAAPPLLLPEDPPWKSVPERKLCSGSPLSTTGGSENNRVWKKIQGEEEAIAKDICNHQEMDSYLFSITGTGGMQPLILLTPAES